MSKGPSTLQRRIMDALPAKETDEYGTTVRAIAFDVGYFDTFVLSKDPDLLKLQLALGCEPGKRRVTKQQHFTVWRALRSLEHRGLVAHQRYDDGTGDWWWRAPEAGT